ncbi:MAG: PIN domain-containing protein [Bacteroidota bacterium]
MRLYLDICAIQRPLDDASQLRVRLEAEAVLGALKACGSGAVTLVASDVHLLEVRRNPHPKRRTFALEVLALAPEILAFTQAAAERARGFASANITGPDALHLAAAIEANADYFCTTDDKLLRRSARVNTSPVAIVSPLDLATVLDQL